MPRTRARRVAFGTAAALVLVLAGGCRAAQPDAPEVVPLTWNRLVLPPGVAPMTVTTSGGRLLVAGHAGSGEQLTPALLSVSGDAVQTVELRPHTPYGRVADLVSVAGDGHDLVALGAAHGGAHANFRWTVWTGSTTAGLDDRLQTFETFGGQSAGSLLGVVSTGDGPVVAGSWSGEHGLDAAVWRPHGLRWDRAESAGTALANTAELQVAPRTVSAAGTGVVLSGSVITFTDGVRQQAAIWRSAGVTQPWTLVRLPEAGVHSEARSARCTDGACWVAGAVDGALALWSTAGAGPGAGAGVEQTVRRADLPQVEVDTEGPGPQVFGTPDRPGVLFSHGGSSGLLRLSDQGWRRFDAPAGQVSAAATLGDRLYAVFTDGPGEAVWSTDLAAIRPG